MIRGLLYALISATAYSSMAILVKLGYAADMTGPVMMQFRFTFGALCMFAILLAKDRTLFHISLKDLGKCAFLGSLVFWAQTTCFVTALKTLPASTTALVLYAHPVLVALLSAFFLGMKINRAVVASLTLVITGCCLVFYDAFMREADATGLVFAVGAMTIFSLYLILVQVMIRRLRPMTATFYVMLFAAISFTISGDITAWTRLTTEQTIIGLTLGVVPGVIAITLLYSAIERIGSSYACIFSSVEPIFTLSSAAVFLGENVVVLQMGGAILIILGIIIPNLSARKAIRS